MAWGGGTYTVQNKVLPGAYFKFESETGVNNIFSDRGVVAIADSLAWGTSGVRVVTHDEFLKDSEKIFGYGYSHEKMKPWRELFYGAQKIILFRLGDGEKASNANATALYAGTRGNDLSISITAQNANFVVTTKLDGRAVDEQTVGTANELRTNDWVTFKGTALNATSGDVPLTGGTDGAVLVKDYQNALNAFEGYSFDVLACLSTEESVKKLFESWTKTMINSVGKYHQLVVFQDTKVSDKYVISVHNKVKDADAKDYALVYYVAGIQASCAVNKDLTAHDYQGEYVIDGDLTHTQLEELLGKGQFVFHRVDNAFSVLTDLNTFTDYKNVTEEGFRYNQSMRVLNQRANDVQKLFIKRYLGKVGTNANARALFKNDLVNNMEKGLLRLEAVSDYVAEDTVVVAGDAPRSYYVKERIKPNLSVTHLYQDIILAREGE